jgi:hypothetical protein
MTFVLPGCFLVGMLSSAGRANAETVNLPLTIDYPPLRSLVAATAFTDPGEAARRVR